MESTFRDETSAVRASESEEKNRLSHELVQHIQARVSDQPFLAQKHFLRNDEGRKGALNVEEFTRAAKELGVRLDEKALEMAFLELSNNGDRLDCRNLINRAFSNGKIFPDRDYLRRRPRHEMESWSPTGGGGTTEGKGEDNAPLSPRQQFMQGLPVLKAADKPPAPRGHSLGSPRACCEVTGWPETPRGTGRFASTPRGRDMMWDIMHS